MGIYLFVIGAFDLKYAGEYNRHAQGWMASVPCQLVGSLAMLSSEVSVLLLTYMTLEKYFSIVFPFSYRRASRKQTASVLAAIWLLGLSLSVVPLCCKESFGNYYGRNGVCFPLQSELGERPSARGFSTTIYLGEALGRDGDGESGVQGQGKLKLQWCLLSSHCWKWAALLLVYQTRPEQSFSPSPGLNLAAFITIVFAYTGMFYSIRITTCRTAESSVCPREVAIAKRFFFIVFTDALCWIPIFLLKLLSLLQVEIPGEVLESAATHPHSRLWASWGGCCRVWVPPHPHVGCEGKRGGAPLIPGWALAEGSSHEPPLCGGCSPLGEAGCLMAFPGWSRHRHILGGHLHPAHQQRTQPHPLHHHHGSLPGEGEGLSARPAPRAELPAELHAGGAIGGQPLTPPGTTSTPSIRCTAQPCGHLHSCSQVWLHSVTQRCDPDVSTALHHSTASPRCSALQRGISSQHPLTTRVPASASSYR